MVAVGLSDVMGGPRHLRVGHLPQGEGERRPKAVAKCIGTSPNGYSSVMLQANVVEGVHRIEDAYTNWYIVDDGAGRLTVVDAGVRSSWRSLHEALARLGRRATDIEAVVLTHAHFDHVGFAERARRELGIPVHVHEDDVPLCRHPLRYSHERPRSWYFLTQWRALPVVVAMTVNGAWFADGVRSVVRFGDDAGTLPVPGGLRVIHTPGHTIGHCSLVLEGRDAVITGDAIVTLDPYTGMRGPRLVARAATADSQRNMRVLDAIAQTGARTLLVGHGAPWTRGAEAAVAQAREAGTR
jgi:glyoxylase-like metal-dependent hydrolase (beta-lactamase superfamily II)